MTGNIEAPGGERDNIRLSHVYVKTWLYKCNKTKTKLEHPPPRIWNKHEEPFHWIFNPCASMTSTLSNDHSSQIVSEKKKNVERSKNLNTKRKKFDLKFCFFTNWWKRWFRGILKNEFRAQRKCFQRKLRIFMQMFRKLN